jgi:signal transduction histidine kinase
LIPPDVTLLFLPEETSAEIAHLREMNRNLVTLTAHELSPPLTFILAYLRLWQERAPRAERAELDFVVEQALALKERLDQVLLLDQLEVGLWQMERELVYVQEVITRVLDAQRWRIQDKEISLSVHIRCNRPLWADKEMLSRALEELFINACKFSRVQGQVQLHAECENGMCHILVTDQGGGISEEMQAQMFEPTFQLDAAQVRREQGLGIGLKLVRTIAEKHGGSIEVISQLGHGSTFTLAIPMV